MLKYIELGVFKISTFSLAIGIGVLCAILIFLKTLAKKKIDDSYQEKLFLLLPFIIVGGLFGGMLFDKIAHWGENGAKWYEPAGISFAGGLIMGVLLYILSHLLIMRQGFKGVLKDAELFVIPLLVAHGFGRIGCFFAGCCYGKPSDCFLAVTFPEGSLQHEQYGYITPVLPTQLFESAFLFIFAAVMLWKVPKYRLTTYLIGYGVFRFYLEFLRGDNRGKLSNIFSPSQITSIIFIISGITLLIYILKIKLFKNSINE